MGVAKRVNRVESSDVHSKSSSWNALHLELGVSDFAVNVMPADVVKLLTPRASIDVSVRSPVCDVDEFLLVSWFCFVDLELRVPRVSRPVPALETRRERTERVVRHRHGKGEVEWCNTLPGERLGIESESDQHSRDDWDDWTLFAARSARRQGVFD